MYTRRVRRPRELRRAPLGREPVGSARAARHSRRRIPAVTPVEMPVDRAAAAAVAERLAHVAPTPSRSAGRHARQRRQSVPALAGRHRSRTVDRRLAIGRSRHAASSSRRVRPKREAAARVIADARARLGGDRRRADPVVRRVLAGGAARAARPRALYIGGDSGPLHIAATSSVPIVGALRPDAAGPVGAVAQRGVAHRRRSMPAALPCRPCDQRACEPGDFRCLTSIHPAQVIEAASELWHATGRVGRVALAGSA